MVNCQGEELPARLRPGHILATAASTLVDQEPVDESHYDWMQMQCEGVGHQCMRMSVDCIFEVAKLLLEYGVNLESLSAIDRRRRESGTPPPPPLSPLLINELVPSNQQDKHGNFCNVWDGKF